MLSDLADELAQAWNRASLNFICNIFRSKPDKKFGIGIEFYITENTHTFEAISSKDVERIRFQAKTLRLQQF